MVGANHRNGMVHGFCLVSSANLMNSVAPLLELMVMELCLPVLIMFKDTLPLLVTVCSFLGSTEFWLFPLPATMVFELFRPADGFI